MKTLLAVLLVLGTTNAFARVSSNGDGTWTSYSSIMLNGISYGAGEVCYDGANLITTKVKARAMYRENGQGDKIVVGQKVVKAGSSFPWKSAVAYADNGQGDSIPVFFERNGVPSFSATTWDSFKAAATLDASEGELLATETMPVAPCNF